MELFPAVLIGGPPHMGKSVLAYSLTHALRERGVMHYVLRAYPDGEGDWANEASQELVRRIRVKGRGTPQWVDRICRDIAARHLPLLVDVGGRPTWDQERIFDYCSHAILLTGDDESHRLWRTMLARHGAFLLADLRSQLRGQGQVVHTLPVLSGTISGLERGGTATGPVFRSLVERVAQLFAYDAAELRNMHLSTAPVETTVDLDRLAHTLNVPMAGEKAVWQPRHLPALLDYLPRSVPLGVYGRAPNWLYAALALLAIPAPFVQFDIRLGWIEARRLRVGPSVPEAPLQCGSHPGEDVFVIAGALPQAYIDYRQLDAVSVPLVPNDFGVVLSGKLPHWLYTSLAVTYSYAPWIAVYQPQLECAVVVSAKDHRHKVGTCRSIVPPKPTTE